MKSAPFDFARPADLAGLSDALGGDDVKILAGGQSLVPMLNLRLAPAAKLVDLRNVPELRKVEERSGSILYGALTTHAAFEDRLVPDGSNGLMPFIAAGIAFRSVRNRGTIGGALALADPAADWLSAAVALEARVHLKGASGDRIVPAEEFVLGPYFTAIEDREVIAAVEVPRRAMSERWGVCKVRIKVGDYAQSLAIALRDRAEHKARLVLGAVDGAPLVLNRTAKAVIDGASPADIEAVAFDEIVSSGREFTAGRLTMHVTAVRRAIRDAEEQ